MSDTNTSVQIPPKATAVTDTHGDRWDHVGNTRWRFGPSEGPASYADEPDLLAFYGPLTVIEWRTADGDVRTEPMPGECVTVPPSAEKGAETRGGEGGNQ